MSMKVRINMKSEKLPTTMATHPAADLFPMMADDELQELAADIAANGLLHPVIIDDHNQIIDGRNRLAACRIANVEPRFEQLNGHDPLAYIVSANLARRNLTKGQQAMALAMIYPEGIKGKRSSETKHFSSARLSQARSILRHSRDLAESVLKGTLPFDEALAKVEELKQEANSADAKLARLQATAPDLAARVADEHISLGEAMTILYQREEDVRRTRESARIAAQGILHFAGQVGEIHSGIQAGEDIRIPPSHLKTLRDALEILTNDMQGSDDHEKATR